MERRKKAILVCDIYFGHVLCLDSVLMRADPFSVFWVIQRNDAVQHVDTQRHRETFVSGRTMLV